MILKVLVGVACVSVIAFVGIAAFDRFAAPLSKQEQIAADCKMYEDELQRSGQTRETNSIYDTLMKDC